MPPFRAEEFYGGESFQNRHWSMATRASPKCELRLCRSLLRRRREKVTKVGPSPSFDVPVVDSGQSSK